MGTGLNLGAGSGLGASSGLTSSGEDAYKSQRVHLHEALGRQYVYLWAIYLSCKDDF